MQMNILNIIEKKRNKKELTKEEIEYFVKEYNKGNITDYQAAALIMAIYIQGMTNQETTDLAIAMAKSGEILDLSSLKKVIVDKHSTGGVGDKVSIIVLPLVASCGVTIAKMSGRGLGFTGGTVDKLESIPGYRTNIETNEFIKNVKKIGISMISQTMDLAPVDKKIYELRDSIACVDNVSLIASSIMSKKIASGAQKIVLDVTVGDGAFMKTKKEAEELAKEMIQIGNLANRETVCVLTSMEEPLGYNVGNSLEVKEAIKALKGDIAEDVKQVVLEIGSYMLKLAGVEEDIEKCKKRLEENLNNGKAYEKFKQLVENQSGDVTYISDTDNFEEAKYIEPIYSEETGYIYEIKAEAVGKIACSLGAGRVKKEDKIDPAVGIIFEKKVGDLVQKGNVLAYIHSNDLEKLKNAKEELTKVIKIRTDKVKKIKTIIKIIDGKIN